MFYCLLLKNLKKISEKCIDATFFGVVTRREKHGKVLNMPPNISKLEIITLEISAMSSKEDFESSVTRSKELAVRPSNEDLLKMYGLYKQATVGDNNEERPGGFDFKAIAKFEAWHRQKGKSKEEAREEYIALVDRLSNAS